jgi:hypothetical protein
MVIILACSEEDLYLKFFSHFQHLFILKKQCMTISLSEHCHKHMFPGK